MDNSGVGKVIIICFAIFTLWGLRRPLYAIYLEYGTRAFYGFLLTPFVAFFEFFRLLKYERNKWADETIRKHRESK